MEHWFTVNEVKCEKLVLDEITRRRTNQPIRGELTFKRA